MAFSKLLFMEMFEEVINDSSRWRRKDSKAHNLFLKKKADRIEHGSLSLLINRAMDRIIL